jgi:hypothetical protein
MRVRCPGGAHADPARGFDSDLREAGLADAGLAFEEHERASTPRCRLDGRPSRASPASLPTGGAISGTWFTCGSVITRASGTRSRPAAAGVRNDRRVRHSVARAALGTETGRRQPSRVELAPLDANVTFRR